MRDLSEIRNELDRVDCDIVELFERRMQLCREVAAYKIAHDMQVLDQSREEQVLNTRASQAEDETLRASVRELYVKLMQLSRAEQQKLLEEAGRTC